MTQVASFGLIVIGVFAGSIPWVVRSIFDIFYVERRRRQAIAFAISADIRAILITADSLQQREFLLALSNGNLEQSNKTKRLALVRSDSVVDPLNRFIPDIYLLKSEDIVSVFFFYRNVYTLRIIFSKLDDMLKTDASLAFSLGGDALKLYDTTRTQAIEISEKLNEEYKNLFRVQIFR